MRRVVVTGLGLVTPLAGNTNESWRRLLAGESGIKKIDRFDVSDIPAQIAGLVPTGSGENDFNADDYVPPKEQRRIDTFIKYGIGAASLAIEDSGWVPQSDEDRNRTGVIIGSGIGGLPEIEKGSILLHEQGPRKISPFFIPACLVNLVSGQVSIKYGLKGPNHAVVTACATGAHAIGDASRLIKYGDADVMVAGGAECAVCRIGIAGFAAARALSTGFNDTPEKASRPWDQNRDGFVMGEGAGVVVLEEYEHAKARGAKIYGEVAGYGLSGDAYHITSPAPEGEGGYRAMQGAMKDAQINPEDVDYINAHGTSTPVGDLIEVQAVTKMFGSALDNISMSSTKSSIGHLLGAAGSVEAIFGLLAMKDQVAPPTINLENPAEETKHLDLVPLQPKERKIDTVLSNSFGFGGTNATLILKKV